MKKHSFASIGILMAVLIFAGAVYADSFSETIEAYKKFPEVQPFFGSAYAYAVFPSVGKGGIGIGGAYGKGQVYRGGQVTGKVSLTKVTVGLQLGG